MLLAAVAPCVLPPWLDVDLPRLGRPLEGPDTLPRCDDRGGEVGVASKGEGAADPKVKVGGRRNPVGECDWVWGRCEV